MNCASFHPRVSCYKRSCCGGTKGVYFCHPYFCIWSWLCLIKSKVSQFKAKHGWLGTRGQSGNDSKVKTEGRTIVVLHPCSADSGWMNDKFQSAEQPFMRLTFLCFVTQLTQPRAPGSGYLRVFWGPWAAAQLSLHYKQYHVESCGKRTLWTLCRTL